MRSFEEYWNEHGDVYAMEIAEEAWDYQQLKIDELQKQLIDQGQRFNEQSQRVRDLEHKNGELQKLVDALEKAEFKLAQVKAIIEKNPKLLESILVKKIEQALKGGSDE